MTARRNLLINAKKVYDGKQVVIDAFKNKIFPLSFENFLENKCRDEDESNAKFYTAKELETIPELPNFENEEETPTNMSELESETPSEQGRKTKGQG